MALRMVFEFTIPQPPFESLMKFGAVDSFSLVRFGFSKQANDRNKSIAVVGILLAHLDLGVV